MYLGTGLAEEKGIQDGDRVRVFNDVGSFVVMAKVTPVMPPGTVMIDHAWEPHQFEGKSGLNSVVAGILSPLEMTGGYGHINFSMMWDGNQIAHESSVDVERV